MQAAINIETGTWDFNKPNIINGDIEMASSFYWRPICNNDNPINKQLKWILMEEDRLSNPLSTKDLEFLKGLKAAGIQDAEVLIEAIEKYGYIELYEVG